MGKLSLIKDGLMNVVANLGTPRDKAANSHIVQVFRSDQELLTAFREVWSAKKIVKIPPRDSVREWRAWQASAKQITKIEGVERALGLQLKLEEALIKSRLFGGGAIYIGTSASEPSKLLNVESESLKYLTVFQRSQLTAGEIEDDIASEYFGLPKWYTVTNTQQRIHPSRLVIFKGEEIPDSLVGNQQYQGWGDSVLASCLDSIMRAENTMANAASLVFEAKVDVIRIPDLMDTVKTQEGENSVIQYMRLQAAMKGINGAIVVDKEVDYDAKSASFGGLPELIEKFLQEVSGASDIPATRLLGMSPSGLNSTGEADLRNYYDRIRADQTLTIGPAMAKLDEMIIRLALGSRPAEIHYNWNSLWQPTAKEQADIGKVIADTIKTLVDTQLYSSDALGIASINLLTERGVVPGLENAAGDLLAGEDEEVPLDPVGTPVADSVPRSLYVSRKVVNVSDITNWAKSQGFEDIESDLHVTVAYSREAVDWIAMGQGWADDNKGNMEIRPGGPRVVEPLGSEGAIVLMFASSDLYWRNRDMREKGASWDYEDYQPHVTITYKGGVDLDNVKPYTGKIVLGPEIFEEIK